MKQIKDERLVIQNLKNIRIVFVVQTLGIVAVLISQAIKEGITKAVTGPLWLVFILSFTVFSALNLKVVFDIFDTASKRKKPRPFYPVPLIAVLIGGVFALLAKVGPDKSSTAEALIVGSVFSLCFLVTGAIVYSWEKRRSQTKDL